MKNQIANITDEISNTAPLAALSDRFLNTLSGISGLAATRASIATNAHNPARPAAIAISTRPEPQPYLAVCVTP
jgi:hypothetical protein